MARGAVVAKALLFAHVHKELAARCAAEHNGHQLCRKALFRRGADGKAHDELRLHNGHFFRHTLYVSRCCVALCFNGHRVAHAEALYKLLRKAVVRTVADCELADLRVLYSILPRRFHALAGRIQDRLARTDARHTCGFTRKHGLHTALHGIRRLIVIFRVKCLQKLALLLQKTVLREQAVFVAQRREQNALQHFGKRLLHIFAVERIRVRNAGCGKC